MPWIHFNENFDWQPFNARWMIAYKAGKTYLVKQDCAEMAIQKGKGEYTERPENARRQPKI